MSFVALKNVKKETWLQFKSESARHGMSMSEFFETLVREHKGRGGSHKAAWDKILKRKPLLTKREADELKEAIDEFRKGFAFREVM